MRKVLLAAIAMFIFPLTSFSQVLNISVMDANGNFKDSFKNDSVSISFIGTGHNLTIYVFNKLNERLYIEWENFRWNGSGIAFGDDSRLSMGREKADEVVIGKESTHKTIIRKENVKTYGVTPWISSSFAKNGGKQTLWVIVPIRYSSGIIKDYKLCLRANEY